MTIDVIAYGIFVYFLGLIISGIFSLIGGQWKKSAQLFILTNAVGFLTGFSYLIKFAPKQIILTEWNWLFHFSPTMSLLSAIFFVVISGVATLVGVYALRYLELYQETYNPALTQFLTVFFVLGMQGVLFANNSLAFMFFWEVMSVASFFLVMADKSESATKAAFLYFIMTHLGGGAILGGFLILSHGNIFFNLSDVAIASQNLSPQLLALTFALFLFGFGSKAGLVPFHVWLPEAHPEAPSNISALMSGLMLKVAIFGFIKIVFSLIGLPSWAGLVVIALGLISGVTGALNAVIERDIKRAFAYSSIENMGIIFTMLGVSLYLFSQHAPLAIVSMANVIVVFAIFHAINHSLFKTALFLSSGVIINRFHSKRLEVMGGLAKVMPIFSVAFLIAILSSMPIAPFGTFFGEWGFIQNLVNILHGSTLDPIVLIVLLITLAIIGLISALAVFAMIKIFGISMLGLDRSKHMEKRAEKTDYLLTFPILILASAVVVLGIFAKPIIAWMVANVGSLTNLENPEKVVLSGLSSVLMFVVLAVILFLTYLAKKVFVKKESERTYHTWDCGQPINETMQYSATAFSAPIRFFFLHLLKRDKKIESVPVVQTNPWIRKYTFNLTFGSVWRDRLYQPVVDILNFFADRIKVIQGGRIQYYLLFVLGTLIITLIIVL
jgi:hydrogenase-4 component B